MVPAIEGDVKGNDPEARRRHLPVNSQLHGKGTPGPGFYSTLEDGGLSSNAWRKLQFHPVDLRNGSGAGN